MTIKSDAKEIALHFLEATGNRATSAIMGKTINQIKNLLVNGYTKDEIIEVIDHIQAKGIKIYSFGYINVCINSILHEIEQNKQNQTKANLKKAIRNEVKQQETKETTSLSVEVVRHTSTNKDKIARFGVQNSNKYDGIF